MTTGVVVRCIFFAGNQQFRVEKLSVVTRANLVDRGGVKVDEDRARDVFSTTGLSEDGIELATIVEGLRIRIGTSILLETVLEEVAGSLLVGR